MKILCIDGGGIRGTFAVAILKAIEKELDRPVGEMFDIIAGTSTGAIIAASAALNKDMGAVLESYKSYAEKIFVRQARIGLLKSVYSDRQLRRFFKQAFGEHSLADIEKPLLIPAVDITHGKPYVHRSNYGVADESELAIKLWDAVLSSCSAPIYFPPNNVHNKYLSVDGGLWADNPSLVCITEALRNFGKSLKEINILSIGTGRQNIDFAISENKYWGVRHWLPFQFHSMKVTPKLLDLALHLSAESVSYHSELLLEERYLRLNCDLGGEIPFDDVKCMDKLAELGAELFSSKKAEILRFIKEEDTFS